MNRKQNSHTWAVRIKKSTIDRLKPYWQPWMSYDDVINRVLDLTEGVNSK